MSRCLGRNDRESRYTKGIWGQEKAVGYGTFELEGNIARTAP